MKELAGFLAFIAFAMIAFIMGIGSAFAIATLTGMITSPNDIINPWLLWGSVLFWFVALFWISTREPNYATRH